MPRIAGTSPASPGISATAICRPRSSSDGRLRIRHDHVIEDMLLQLGARLERGQAPFQPEGGAYAGLHRHG